MSSDALVIDGVPFVRSRDAVRTVGFTPDYITTLARSGFIMGTPITSLQQFVVEQERINLARRACAPGSRRAAPRRPSATFYKRKAKFGGLDVSDARRLKALEDENGKLKKLLAETMLDIAILKDINARKW